MPEQDVKAGELNKAKEVFDVVPPSGEEAAEVVHPSEEPLGFALSKKPGWSYR
jgi:hypothetical protein